jgi:hypothetical protein
MSDASWPDPERPGWPPAGAAHGSAHVLRTEYGNKEIFLWDYYPKWWVGIGRNCSPDQADENGFEYLGPALTPAEVAAAVAAAFDDGAQAMREIAARAAECDCANRNQVVFARSNAERSQLCGRAPFAALLGMDIRMLPLPAMEKEPGNE